ncbi:excalibur calcium-binding domain-containing protein [Exiguobacterium sp. B2(2022)]|uniref:excalibur calcium-binding domain-containing protein n=1 Tax=Exiguobacterium sp. B2(2022) TaxID=2992755 RepID=UPI00237B1370|nr:excalibur calcium-binding domain-containing protein [Exiguobacterium sp. B2(2022)]MDE0563191.1 excalibur calcium-binding domain-containing protein [Exiguobacterium sp. B2(2022)]
MENILLVGLFLIVLLIVTTFILSNYVQQSRLSPRFFIIFAVLSSVLLLASCSFEETISMEQYEQDLSLIEEKLSSANSEKEKLQDQLDSYLSENEDLRQQLTDAKESTNQKLAEAETKLREEFESELKRVKEEAAQQLEEEVASVRKEEQEKSATAIAEVKQELEQQAKASESTKSNTQTSQPSENFQNCTDLRGTYPGGVSSDHPAYQSKMDRDNDGWACE